MIVRTDCSKRAEFQIDEADLPAVSMYPWKLGPKGYVETCVGKFPKQKTLTLHKFLLGPAPSDLVWDHENRDPMDNRRINLRLVTRSVNVRNAKRHRSNTSGIRGVHWDSRKKRWRASITVNWKNIHGHFHRDIADAAAERRRMEVEHWGENLGEQPL